MVISSEFKTFVFDSFIRGTPFQGAVQNCLELILRKIYLEKDDYPDFYGDDPDLIQDKWNEFLSSHFDSCSDSAVEFFLEEFEIPISTLENWLTGATCPHPEIQKKVGDLFLFLQEEIHALKEKKEGS